MQSIFKVSKHILLLGLAFFIFTKNIDAQKVEFNKGYYVTEKDEKVEGYFDLEFFRQNNITFKKITTDEKVVKLDINSIKSVILEKGEKDSSIFLTTMVNFKGVNEKIYLEYILKGEANLLRGFSKNEYEIFYISSKELTSLRRINKSNPKTFLLTYFSKCKDSELKLKNNPVFYDKESLSKAIIILSNCSDIRTTNQINYVQYDFFKKLSIGIQAFSGIATPKSHQTFYREDLQFKGFSSGTGFNIQLNATNRLIVSAGLEYISSHFKATDSISVEKNGEWTTTFTFKTLPTMSYNKISFTPIELKYQFLKKLWKFQPNISLGFSLSKNLRTTYVGDFDKNKYEVRYADDFFRRYSINIPNPPKSIISSYGYDKYLQGLILNIGAKRQFNNNTALNLGFRYLSTKEDIALSDSFGYEGVSVVKTHFFYLYAQFIYTLK